MQGRIPKRKKDYKRVQDNYPYFVYKLSNLVDPI